MKTKNKMMMVAMLVVSCIALQAANYTQLINGTLYTNATVVLVNSTNQVGVVLANSTNKYSLLANYGAQDSVTNWPAASFSPQGSYPNTIYAPYRNAAFYLSTPAQAIDGNSTRTMAQVTFAASVDGVNWASNYLTIAVSVTNNVVTNIDTLATPYLAIQSIGNTNATTPLTNILIEVSGKPQL